MANENNFGKVEVLIVGGGPAGLACAIQLKVLRPGTEICVIEKGAELGNHNLSGAVLEKEPIHTLLDAASPGTATTAAGSPSASAAGATGVCGSGSAGKPSPISKLSSSAMGSPVYLVSTV